MHDETSAKDISSTIVGLRGIEDVDVNYEEGTITVYYDENQVIVDKIKYVIEKKGYDIDTLN
jgi:copper chaperone CopZ